MAAKYDFVIEQFASFRRVVRWLDEDGNPIDLTGWTSALQCREAFDDPVPVLDLSDGFGLTITPADGEVEIRLTPTETAALKTGRLGYYDLVLTSPGAEVERLLMGMMNVSPGATQ